jgi:alpha-glucosidase
VTASPTEQPAETHPDPRPETATGDWWREAVVYQVYVPSFADSDGDGMGDLRGVADRLDHLAGLGVDALWLTPFYPSPWGDGGYDVSDYRGVDPRHGSLDDFRDLLDGAHARGLKVIIDIVPNHCSDRHSWFAEALASPPGAAARERFHFRDGRSRDGGGPGGELPPADWQSKFGGPAWTQVEDGQWYMHIFAAEQPDLNWENPEVAAEFERTLRFWLDLGADGFRVDVAHGMCKDLAEPLRDTRGHDAAPLNSPPEGEDHPFWDRDGVHQIHRSWRKILDTYEPPRIAVAEAGVSAARLPLYTRPDELHQAFNFFHLRCPWDAAAFRRVVDDSLAGARSVGTLPTWVLSNHDVVRHTTRYGLPEGTDYMAWLGTDGRDPAPDVELGRRRARAAALLTLALPGTAYLYQGEELGLPEVADLPADALRDPMWERTGHTQKGRDGCRVPLPWAQDGPSYGFGPGGSWLPQPEGWGRYAARAQRGVPGSFLELYRAALRLRRGFRGAGAEGERLEWLDAGNGAGNTTGDGAENTAGDGTAAEGELAFRRGGLLECRVNLSGRALQLPSGAEVILSSEGGRPDVLAPDTAVWLRPGGSGGGSEEPE